MGRYRSRSRSYSPARRSRSYSPPLPPQRKRYDDPRERYRSNRSFRDRRSSAPSGLLVRNISLDARPEDLRVPFERFGPVKDVYLPKNYYTGEPRGFGFVKFRNPDDAAEAKQQMNHQVIGGREITIVFAEENRKTPQEMRTTGSSSGRSGGGYRRRTPPRRRYRSYSRSLSPPRHDSSPRRRHLSNSRSPSPARHESRGRERGKKDGYYSPRQSVSHSPSLSNEKDYKPNRRSRSPVENGLSPHNEDYRLDQRSSSPRRNGRSQSGSPSLRQNGRSRSRSRSYSPR